MKTKILITAGIVLLIAVGVLSMFGVWRWEMRQELNRAWSDWIAAGGPATLRDFQPAPLPDERNAAVDYRRAFALIESLSEEDVERLRTATSPDDVADLVVGLEEAIAIAIEARGMAECQWDPSIFEMEDFQLHWFRPGGSLTRALIFDAELKAQRGAIDQAVLSLEAALALSAHLASDPFLIAIISHVHLEVMLLEAIERIFRDVDLPESSRLAEIIEARDYRKSIAMVIHAEALYYLNQFDRLDEWEESMEMWSRGETPPGYRWFHWWFLDLDRAALLDAMRATAQALAQPPPTRIGRVIDPHELPPYALASWVFMPGYGSIDATVGRAEVKRALFLAAMELREHRAEHGQYPDSWEMPADPMTGNAMHYTREGEGGFALEADFTDRRSEQRTRWQWR